MSPRVARTVLNQVGANQDKFNQRTSGASSYESSSSSYSSSGYSGDTSSVSDSYDSSSTDESSTSYSSSGYESSRVSSGDPSLYELSSVESSTVYDSGIEGQGYNASLSSFRSQTTVQTYPIDTQRRYIDSNPQIIRRPAANNVQTSTKNRKVRFLQPSPIPPPSPLIIKKVRPPQSPSLRIRQQVLPLSQHPSLILRERPLPGLVASQTVTRRLAALPIPLRPIIIERIPLLSPPPRDIIIERRISYGAQAKRHTIQQRVAPVQQFAHPRNVIIHYEPVQKRIVRQFQRFGITQANPQPYHPLISADFLYSKYIL